MIKLISLILAILLTAAVQQARADSLECQYRGQFLTYTEVEKSEDEDTVKSVVMSQVYSSVRFYNGKEYRYGSIIPCAMIKEDVDKDVDKTKFLKEYQSQFE